MDNPMLGKMIIRNDHDELLLLMERFRLHGQVIVNYDRHSDLYDNPQMDVGSWGLFGLKSGVIKKFIWIPAGEGVMDMVTRCAGRTRLKLCKDPIVLSLCYDYFIGNGMKANLKDVSIKVTQILEDIKEKNVQFVFAARSPQWSDPALISAVDQILMNRFKDTFPFFQRLSQSPLTKKK